MLNIEKEVRKVDFITNDVLSGELVPILLGHSKEAVETARRFFKRFGTVSHLFCREMKISPKQYVLQKKLSYAARLISEGVAATEAARRVGYDNYANFYKLHKKLFGTAPTEGGAKALRDSRSAE